MVRAFEDAVVGPGGHVHALHGIAKFLQADGVGLGVFVEQGRGHLGVAVDTGLVLEAALLEHPCSDDTLADGGAGFAWGFRRHLVKINGLDFYLQVNAVEQRTRNLAHIMRALVLVADALLLGMTVVATRARVHRSHEHERSRIFRRVFRPRNRNNPVLQRLAHHLQDISRKFRQFVKKEDPIVGQADLTRHGVTAAAHEGNGRNGVMRAAEGARGHQRGALGQLARHTVNLGGLEGLAERERRHDGWQPLGHHRLAPPAGCCAHRHRRPQRRA